MSLKTSQILGTIDYCKLIYKIIGASLEVYNTLGHGLLESVYQEALSIELSEMEISCACEIELPVFYKGQMLSKKFRLDMLVENDIIVELKSVAHLGAEHRHQLCNYLRLTQKPVGLLINFGGNTLIGERWIFDKETNDCFIVDKNMTPIE